MRNGVKSNISRIIEKASKLPFFTIADLASMETDRVYLKVLLSRYAKSGRVVRLKKGMYVAREYIHAMEKAGTLSAYPEFLCTILHNPSYLSLEYMLYKHNILTEVPVNVTAVTTKKTASFVNAFGTFVYHSIRADLFCGYDLFTGIDFRFQRARKAKALFDFLYFRKQSIPDKRAAHELRLNVREFNRSETHELARYIKMEGSQKMKNIYGYLFD